MLHEISYFVFYVVISPIPAGSDTIFTSEKVELWTSISTYTTEQYGATAGYRGVNTVRWTQKMNCYSRQNHRFLRPLFRGIS